MREDVQVIVVDDCSPDADTYLERYPELSRPYLEFYSTDRGGSAGRARNVGLKHAKGKWLIFADADDLFSDELSDILDRYVTSLSDVIFFDCNFVSTIDVSISVKRNDEYFIKRLFTSDNAGIYARCDCPVPWGKIIRKELAESSKASFDETRWSNDIVFSTIVGCSAKSISFVNRVLYLVTTREESLTARFCSTKNETIVRIVESLRAQSIIESSGYDLEEMVIIPYLYRVFLNDRELFWTVILDLKRYGISKVKTIKQMFKKVGRAAILKSIVHDRILSRRDTDYVEYVSRCNSI